MSWLLSWLCFALADFVRNFDCCRGVYRKLMLKSLEYQGEREGLLWPWKACTEEENAVLRVLLGESNIRVIVDRGRK